MATIRKAVEDDFDRVYPLLLSFNNPCIESRDWRHVFTNHWGTLEGHCGYLMEDESEVVGFLGLIFAVRTIRGIPRRFCNLTCWVVREPCRNMAILLLLEGLKPKHYTFTALTPATQTQTMLQRFGFKELETSQRLLRPALRCQRLLQFGRGVEIVYDEAAIEKHLGDDEIEILRDHKPFRSVNVLAKTRVGNCYIMLNRRKFAHPSVVHISHRDIFKQHAFHIASCVCRDLNFDGIVVDERYLSGARVARAIMDYDHRLKLFRSPDLYAKDIDDTYSEIPMLHI